MATRICGSHSAFLLIIFLVFSGGVLNAQYSWVGGVLSSLFLQITSLWLIPAAASTSTGAVADVSWHAPDATVINNLDQVLNTTGVYGYIFNTSETPLLDYGHYNWCNMPHVRRQEYQQVPDHYELVYLEIIQRHHKRTPYQSNTFPFEQYQWNCSDTDIFYYGQPAPLGHISASTFWSIEPASFNPFPIQGFHGSCQFPQTTSGGLEDSWQHGRDIYELYHDLLRFIPQHYDSEKLKFRVTNNVITSQVAGMLISGMYGPVENISLLVQRSIIDSLEPTYSCPAAQDLYTASQNRSPWTTHLQRTQSLFAALDAISGVPSSASDWHVSYDHYFDNLSSRLCHSKPLPCNGTNPALCITQAQADEVFRLGEFEYSYMYRDAPTSLSASTASFGVWVGELAQHLRDQVSGTDGKVIYRHHIAHDGSVSRLLSILQIDVMTWPGMGSEVVFELYRDRGSPQDSDQFFVRVLWGGQVMRSVNPDLGVLDLLPVNVLLAYFDGLVGPKAQWVPALCSR